MPSFDPIPGYADLCHKFQIDNDARDCAWNIITTVWETRGMMSHHSDGANNLIVQVVHDGIFSNSKLFQNEISSVINKVFKKEYHGQPADFFLSSVKIKFFTQKLALFPDYIGEVNLGVLDVYLAEGHMIPMQWFPIVNPNSDLPAEPLGFAKLNCVINTLLEKGAVQKRAPDALADWDLRRDPPRILQIPRLNLRKVAAHQYNIKFSFYKGFDLPFSPGRFSADPGIRVITACGVVKGDPQANTIRPNWNVLIQAPFYEPNYHDLIFCQVVCATSKQVLSQLVLSWKELVCNQDRFREPRWIDIYQREQNNFDRLFTIPGTLTGVDQSPSQFLEQISATSQYKGYSSPINYGGRVLLGIELEPRKFETGEPSPANIAMKPKDCEDKWSDPYQKCMFRFQIFYGEGLNTTASLSAVTVEFCIGRKSVQCKPASKADNGTFEFYAAVELECDFPFDDMRDNPDGLPGKLSSGSGVWNPAHFVRNLPDCVVKVYRTDPVGVGMFNELIGFWRGSVMSVLLGRGDDWADVQDTVFVGMSKFDNGTGETYMGVESIMLNAGDSAPSPTKKVPWGDEFLPDSRKIMHPYLGFQVRELQRDASCKIAKEEHAGFLSFSAKLWLPTREKCANAPPFGSGPPILSPWKEWNRLPIPKPSSDLLHWYAGFSIRAHVYQAKQLQGRGESGVASSFVRLRYANYPVAESDTVHLTNNPTYDTTLTLSDLEMILLPNVHVSQLPSERSAV
eukprot:755797-Hanusia_phi.AAC.5